MHLPESVCCPSSMPAAASDHQGHSTKPRGNGGAPVGAHCEQDKLEKHLAPVPFDVVPTTPSPLTLSDLDAESRFGFTPDEIEALDALSSKAGEAQFLPPMLRTASTSADGLNASSQGSIIQASARAPFYIFSRRARQEPASCVKTQGCLRANAIRRAFPGMKRLT